MGIISEDVDKALQSLWNYVGREPKWQDRLGDTLFSLVAGSAWQQDIEFEVLSAEFGEGDLWYLANAYALEWLATREWGDSKEVLIKEYLARHSWRETPRACAYLRGLCEGGGLVLWEVVDSQPGKHFDVRFLDEKDGEAVRVRDAEASENLMRWHVLAGRLVQVGNEYAMGDGALVFEPREADRALAMWDEVDEFLEQELRRAQNVGRRRLSKAQKSELGAKSDEHGLVMAAFWAWAALRHEELASKAQRAENSDGEVLVLVRTTYPVLGEAPEVESRLDAAANLGRDVQGRDWKWYSGSPDAEGGPAILGHVSMDGSELVLETGSEERGERGARMLEELLGGLVGAPDVMHESFGDAIQRWRTYGASDAGSDGKHGGRLLVAAAIRRLIGIFRPQAD